MTGCPNGCGRPTLAEIGLVGTAYGKYNLHLGGDRLGLRLTRKYKENIGEEEILAELDAMFASYSSEKQEHETFGDYINRKNIVA
jgi:sulfite reductase (NADPH) hemoprotein beta-component